MVKMTALGNGMYSGVNIGEIKTIPYYMLINNNLDRANYANHVFFSQMISSFHRKSYDSMVSFEIMFLSVKVTNQTYTAQVKMYLVIRQMGNNKTEIMNSLSSFENSIRNDLADNFFDIDFLNNDEQLEKYYNNLRQINVTNITSITKKEDGIISILANDGYLYYTHIPIPAENENISNISNVLTQYPECAIIFQIIPTYFNQTELAFIEQTSKMLQYYSGTMMRQMMRPDQTFQNMINTYQTYQAEEKEDLFYYNFLICSSKYCAYDIASKVLDALEDTSKTGGNNYEAVKLKIADIDLVSMLPVSPWQISNTLILILSFGGRKINQNILEDLSSLVQPMKYNLFLNCQLMMEGQLV